MIGFWSGLTSRSSTIKSSKIEVLKAENELRFSSRRKGLGRQAVPARSTSAGRADRIRRFPLLDLGYKCGSEIRPVGLFVDQCYKKAICYNGLCVDHDRCHTCLITQKLVVSEPITFRKRAGYSLNPVV